MAAGTRIVRTLAVHLLAWGLAGTALAQDTIFWDQTKTFQLDNTPEAIYHYEGGASPGMRRFEQRYTLSFQGAPEGFTLAGADYELTAVQVFFTSTFDNTFSVMAKESDYFGDIMATGGAVTTTVVDMPAQARHWYWYDSWEGSIYDENLLFGTEDLPNKFAERSTNLRWDYSFTADWSETSAFTSSTSYDVDLFKGLSMTIGGYSGDDDWDGSANPVSDWSGSMTMRYVYEPVAAPVPEPASLSLAGAGLLLLLAWRRRQRA